MPRGVTVDEVRALALTLPRTTERLVRDRVKFGVGRLIYVAFSRDERTMGFAYPKERRATLVAAEPDRFRLPRVSDQRYNWVDAWLHELDAPEMHELVVDAWCMCVPAKVRAAYFETAVPGRQP
ncbi:MmcQ/YjbR family DNA-binding protein [Pseudonocardia acaciae]|uniref:MmcQ/YjbR family DNA-binding protein n=1 Tax=Pseudonocardia acaciae TaxID=551276 RepID=UPI0004903552|nr:MmcQ/YjbR family DNA-binding protein [Pseudonocardia acaciae]